MSPHLPPQQHPFTMARPINPPQRISQRDEEKTDACSIARIVPVSRESETDSQHSCFFWRFFLRVMVQFVMLTPKPSMLPDAPSENKPFIGAILGSNVLCIILHAIQDAPSAGEATRGYMHGGLAMDFIGQKGPTSRIHLLLLDLLVVFLQLLQLSVHITLQRLKESSSTPRADVRRPAVPTQTLDSEERGVRRSAEIQDIEMQNLNPSRTEPDPLLQADGPMNSITTEQETVPSPPASVPRTDANISDAFNSGQIVIADLDIQQTVREQFWSFQLESAENAEHTRDVRANITGQLLRAQEYQELSVNNFTSQRTVANMTTRRTVLLQRAQHFCAAFLDLANNPPPQLLDEHFSTSCPPQITEHGPTGAATRLPFLGRPFTGRDQCLEYFTLLSQSLEFSPSKDTFPTTKTGFVVDESARDTGDEANGRCGVVSVVGKAVFRAVRTGKEWEESFVWRLSGFDQEGRFARWEIWADPLSAWMAVGGEDLK
nr:dsc e3 ubiquitin ligase complex subunit 4 [Quercus suber]